MSHREIFSTEHSINIGSPIFCDVMIFIQRVVCFLSTSLGKYVINIITVYLMKLVLIVTGTVTDVPQTSPHLVSGVIIVYVIDNTALLQ
jgi:hypothetical protein